MNSRATNFRYPAGARPLLFEETARRRASERRFEALLEGAGFAEIILPIIDYAEPYVAVAAPDEARRSYRFTDRDGELVTLRCDFTPMVARALAPALAGCALPLRAFYRGDVVRCEPGRLGAGSERFQIGAEIVGDPSVEADVAVLRLAAELARAAGAEPLVAFGDAALVAAFDADSRRALVTKSAGGSLSSLATKFVGGTATIDDVVALDPARGERLRAIETAVADDPTFALQLDDFDEDAGYYTGLRFRVFDLRTRRLLAAGGRYDSLYARFSTDAPAVGFTFTLMEAEIEGGA